MGARRRLRAKGPVSMAVYNAQNRHLTLTFEDVRHLHEEASRRAELRARREAAKEPKDDDTA
jgi:hypothetical protein